MSMYVHSVLGEYEVDDNGIEQPLEHVRRVNLPESILDAHIQSSLGAEQVARVIDEEGVYRHIGNLASSGRLTN